MELGLPLRFAIEVDALYSRFGLSSTDAFFGNVFHQSWRANSWEFPVLSKFRPTRLFFVEAGYVPRRLSGSTHLDSTLVDVASNATHVASNATRQVSDQKTDYEMSHGLLAGGGIDVRIGGLRLSPEVRYTRWLSDAFDREGSRGFFLQPSRNRTEVLVTIWWR